MNGMENSLWYWNKFHIFIGNKVNIDRLNICDWVRKMQYATFILYSLHIYICLKNPHPQQNILNECKYIACAIMTFFFILHAKFVSKHKFYVYWQNIDGKIGSFLNLFLYFVGIGIHFVLYKFMTEKYCCVVFWNVSDIMSHFNLQFQISSKKWILR